MAKRRNGRYTLTSRRRAALHKAQLASAKKRRSTRNKRVVAGLALGAGILAVSAGSRYTTKVVKGGPQRPAAVKQLTVHGTTRTEIGRVRRPKRNVTIHPYSKSGRGKIISVSSSGVSTITRLNSDRTKAEEKKNYGRRRSYWQSKPVGGAPRKNARATPQVRMTIKANRRLQNLLRKKDLKMMEQPMHINNVVSLDSRRGKRKK